MYCIACGADNLDSSAHCIRCGQGLKTLRTDIYEKAESEASGPTLWNPDVAALLSWILTPVFGAVIHALNWRAVGQTRKAYISWGWAIFIFLGFTAFTAYSQYKFGDEKMTDRLAGVANLVVLIVWYFSFGRSQSKFIAQRLNGKYAKAGWFNVLCIVVIIFSTLYSLGSRVS